MKRAALFLIAALATLHLCAQEQEDHVVRRGRHKAAVVEVVVKEKKPVNWYSEVSASAIPASLGTVAVSGGFVDDTPFKYIALANPVREYDGVVASVGYKRLARFGNFFIGPGADLTYGTAGLYGGDLLLHMRLQLLGGRFHPFLSASGGVQYAQASLRGAEAYEFTLDKNDYYNQIYGGQLTDGKASASFTRFYADLGAGLCFDVAKHAAVSIRYHATWMPCLDAGLRIDRNEITTLFDNAANWTTETHQFAFGNHNGSWLDWAWQLRHGIEISIMF